MPTVYLRQWFYSPYFGGERQIFTPLTMSETEVRAEIEQRHPGGNWDSKSLRRGAKVKERNAHPIFRGSTQQA